MKQRLTNPSTVLARRTEPAGNLDTVTDSHRVLEVNVLFTTIKGTLSALRMASKLADNLGARIRVIVPQVVPFPLPLSHSLIKPEFTARTVRTITSKHAVETDIQVCLCRQTRDAALSVLKPSSLVVIGGRRRLWPTEETRTAEWLGRQGHQVLFIDQQ
jgi:hypothetical protein